MPTPSRLFALPDWPKAKSRLCTAATRCTIGRQAVWSLLSDHWTLLTNSSQLPHLSRNICREAAAYICAWFWRTLRASGWHTHTRAHNACCCAGHISCCHAWRPLTAQQTDTFHRLHEAGYYYSPPPQGRLPEATVRCLPLLLATEPSFAPSRVMACTRRKDVTSGPLKFCQFNLHLV